MSHLPEPFPLKTAELIQGFKLLEQTELPNLDTRLYEFQHQHSGAHYLHMQTLVDESSFVLAFRTLPEDDRGVAHILEHCVLEGSRKYPVHLFNHLTGRSLYSFLNAMTSSDRTVYPFATPDPQDFENLLDCYLDACFHPLLQDATFLQEGWRLEFQEQGNADSALVYKGIVFNEMKAALSDSNGGFYRRLRRSLFPDLVYSNESGGDPACIPDLSVEELRAFHQKYYHPSNSWCITSGVRNPEAILHKLDHYYSEFDSRKPLEFKGRQPKLGAEKQEFHDFPVSRDTDSSAVQMAVVCWRLLGSEEVHALVEAAFLIEVLAGNLSAPLNRALLDSGLGNSLAPVGLDSWGSQTWFATGLKGVAREKLTDLRDCVMDCLKQLAENGLDSLAVSAVLDRWEYQLRDRGSSSRPWGLALGLETLNQWMLGAKAEDCLRSDKHLERIRQECQDPGFLKKLIRKLLLDNPERLLLQMDAKPGALEQEQQKELERLAKLKAGMTAPELKQVQRNSATVEAYRQRQDDLSCLPRLDPANLNPQAMHIGRESHRHPWPHQRCEQPTNGISMLRLALPLSANSTMAGDAELLSLLPRFAFGGDSLEKSARRIQSLTGGLSLMSFHSQRSSGLDLHRAIISMRCLDRRFGDCVTLLEDLLYDVRLDDEARMKELTAMIQSEIRPGLVSGGTSYSMVESMRGVSSMGDLLADLEGLKAAREALALSADGEDLAKAIQASLSRLLKQGIADVGLCGSDTAMEAAVAQLTPLQQRLGQATSSEAPKTVFKAQGLKTKCWHTDLKGAFVAESLPGPCYTDPAAAQLTLLCKILNKKLYTRVRAEGGAYGSQASYQADSQVVSFLSWRDPRIQGTLADFAAVRREICQGDFSAEELREARIDTIRSLDKPFKPLNAGNRAFMQLLLDRSDEDRSAFRRGVLQSSREELIQGANKWFDATCARSAAVISSLSQIQEQQELGLECMVEAAITENP